MKKLLIVEDNQDIQRLYKRMLNEEYDITQVYDIKQAWVALSKKEYDLMILDIILPNGKFGDEFFMQLSQHIHLRELPVIFSTVINDQDQAASVKNINNAEWINKPFTKKDLMEKIKRMISKN